MFDYNVVCLTYVNVFLLLICECLKLSNWQRSLCEAFVCFMHCEALAIYSDHCEDCKFRIAVESG